MARQQSIKEVLRGDRLPNTFYNGLKHSVLANVQNTTQQHSEYQSITLYKMGRSNGLGAQQNMVSPPRACTDKVKPRLDGLSRRSPP